MTSYRTHEPVESTTALHSRRSDSPQDVLQRPGFASLSGRDRRNLGGSPFLPPRACPLGRRTLDVRASIMLAPIIITNLKMSTTFSKFFPPGFPKCPLIRGSPPQKPGLLPAGPFPFAQFAQAPPRSPGPHRAKRRFLEKRLTWAAEVLQ